MPDFFATAPRGVEDLLAAELTALGAETRPTLACVHFKGTLEIAYRACLHSRLASRVLMPIAEFEFADQEAFHARARAVPWEQHLHANNTIAVDFNARDGAITDSRFGAQRTKDALADRFREREGRRPSVDRDKPDVRLNVHCAGGKARIALDMSGESLHRRGYRGKAGEAPMKENLACAVLYRAGWGKPGVHPDGENPDQPRALLDPFCGSGTLLIEAALMLADIAPGLFRARFGFEGWLGHDRDLWRRLVHEAEEKRAAANVRGPRVYGYDHDQEAVAMARENIRAAGVAHLVKVGARELGRVDAPAPAGLLVCNPPYGERLGDEAEIARLYTLLGSRLRNGFAGWSAAMITAAPDMLPTLRLRARKSHKLYNGALLCSLTLYDMDAPEEQPSGDEGKQSPEGENTGRGKEPVLELGPQDRLRLAPTAAEFRNRLEKNFKRLRKWARKEGVQAYRVYDADIPAYNVALDIYDDHLIVQEYAAPSEIDPRKARGRVLDVLLIAPMVLGLAPSKTVLKLRARQKGANQYEKRAARGEFLEIAEYDCRFLINPHDYLDTGLFPDHRLTRKLIGEKAKGRSFLNLFAYTGTATVHAALGGARSTTTVDLSRTYMDWAARNLELNGIKGGKHRLERMDCRRFLRENRDKYDLIFLDPPTFPIRRVVPSPWTSSGIIPSFWRLRRNPWLPAAKSYFPATPATLNRTPGPRRVWAWKCAISPNKPFPWILNAIREFISVIH